MLDECKDNKENSFNHFKTDLSIDPSKLLVFPTLTANSIWGGVSAKKNSITPPYHRLSSKSSKTVENKK